MQHRIFQKALLFASVALPMGMAAPVWAQSESSADEAIVNEDVIIVNARRVEERLQDVPVSVTVLSEQALANNNITSAKDIATFTPSLVTNNRFGADNTTWTIRGFTQEQRTTATVGTYFADVVALRGSGATQGGDGAGPGNLFDLSNVQVLNGPQGTLFGRNSTGGAVLLVPKRPTDSFEGYVEGSLGDYDMRRFQAVLNIPVADSFRVRLGVDRNQRDGYLKNAGKIGFGPFGNAGGSVDYVALRFSAVADLSPDVENYTVITYSNSQSTGLGPKLINCYNLAACQQKAAEDALGFFTVSNVLPDAGSQIWQWQIINSTKWAVSENLTIKNNFSYGEFRGDTNLDLFGLYGVVPSTVPFGTETSPLQVRPFNTTHYLPNHHTNAESTLVEELQIQGSAADGKLNYQGGLYLEISRPLGLSGIQSTTFTPCSDINTLSCLPFAGGGAVSLGRLSYSTHKNSFIGKAAYFQAGYDFTDRLKATAGIRYTTDKMISDFQVIDLRIGNPIVASAASPRYYDGTLLTATSVRDFAVCTNTPTFGAQGSVTNQYRPLANRFTMCDQHLTSKSSKPTWLLGLDYKPIDDTLLYAKWSRGYRQAGVASFAADKLQVYRPETVDTYEIGAKASWRGAVPGFFNIAGFYNDFKDQQIQLGVQCIPTSLCGQTTAILNVGKSRLSGFEAELGIRPIEGLRLAVSWAHLKTKIKEVNGFTDLAGATASINATVTGLGLPYNDIRPVLPGSVLPNSIPDKVVANGSYTLPLPESVGKLSFGATWIWQSAYKVVADNNALAFNTLYFNSTTPTATPQAIPLVGNGILPKTNYGNINVSWEDVGGMPVDASFFITNVTNRHIRLHANTQETQGVLSSIVAEPRMMGGRVRLKF